MDLLKYIASVKDFPKKGIVFKDITTLLENPTAYNYTIEKLKDYALSVGAEVIVSPDARGFLFGAPVALLMNKGFVPVRKPGKLPRETISKSYDLEYGNNTLSIHKDAIKKGNKVVIIDDLLATGGTLNAACKLVEELGGVVCGIACVIELIGLGGRETLKDYDVHTLVLDKE